MIGKHLSSVLVDIEKAMLEFQSEFPNIPPDFSKDALMASTKIFADCLMDFMWRKMKSDKMPLNWRVEMASKIGKQIRQIVIDSTGIDPHNHYKNENQIAKS